MHYMDPVRAILYAAAARPKDIHRVTATANSRNTLRQLGIKTAFVQIVCSIAPLLDVPATGVTPCAHTTLRTTGEVLVTCLQQRYLPGAPIPAAVITGQFGPEGDQL